MSKSAVDEALEDQANLIKARGINYRVGKALRIPNMPKHKVERYEAAILRAHVLLLNAKERAFSSFKKLSEIDKAVVLTKVTGRKY